MRTVAERFAFGVLALAEEHGAIFLGGILHRLKRRALVRSVTERLGSGFATAAPPIGFASFDIYLCWFFSGDSGLFHGFPLADGVFLGQSLAK